MQLDGFFVVANMLNMSVVILYFTICTIALYVSSDPLVVIP